MWCVSRARISLVRVDPVSMWAGDVLWIVLLVLFLAIFLAMLGGLLLGRER